MRKCIVTLQTPRYAHDDVHRGFDDRFDWYMLAQFDRGVEEVLIKLIHKNGIWSLWFPPYHLMAVHLEELERVTSFFAAAPTQHDHYVQVLVRRTETIYLRKMRSEATSAKQMFQSDMFDGEYAAEEM